MPIMKIQGPTYSLHTSRTFLCCIILIALLLFYELGFSAEVTTFNVDEFVIDATKDGNYTVSIRGETWLTSGPTFFQGEGMHHSTSDGSLSQLAHIILDRGVDKLGEWSRTNCTYGIRAEERVKVVNTYIRVYDDLPVAIFSQHYKDGLEKTTVGHMDGIISSFPTFRVAQLPKAPSLGYLSYGGLFLGSDGLRTGRWKAGMGQLDGGLNSGPLLLFDQHGHVLIISTFSQFMPASLRHNTGNDTVGWGIMGMVDTVPAGYLSETVVFYGNQGINKAMEDWGQLMRKWYDRDTSAKERDLSVNYIGYYTDNGAMYYHKTEPKLNYEDTLLGVYHYAKSNNIPYRYLQYDDWWYYVTGSGYGATTTWDAMPSVFPHGLKYLYNITNLPVVAHNRYWSSKTPYARQNGGAFNFVMDRNSNLSLPDDQNFWDYLFGTAKAWGLVVYEQDFLNYQVQHVRQLHSDATLGSRWLRQMGEAAARYGLLLQYCMADPRHLLASLQVPVVSQARASTDYMREGQWKIGLTSMLADAVGVAPFKDNFWTNHVEPLNPYNKTEESPFLQATVSLLSTGPVGVSDRIAYSDLTLINRLCTDDGLLLKPSKPATAIDAQILQMAFGGNVGPIGEVWSTYSDINGVQFGILFAANLTNTFSLYPTEAGFGQQISENSLVYKAHPGVQEPAPFSDKSPLLLEGCWIKAFCLYYVTPVFTVGKKSVGIFGELSKVVPISPKRVTSIVISDHDLHMTLKGSPGEEVIMYFYVQSNWVKVKCVISESGMARLSLLQGYCQ